MKKSKKTFSPFSWKKHTKPIFLITVIVTVFAVFLLIVYEPMRPGDQISGTLESEYQSKNNPYISKYFVIKLNTGEFVDVPADRLGEFRKDRPVILREMIGVIFGRREYRFLKYAQP